MHDKSFIDKIANWLNTEPDADSISKKDITNPLKAEVIECKFRKHGIRIVFPDIRVDSFIIEGTVVLSDLHIAAIRDRYSGAEREQLNFRVKHEFAGYADTQFRAHFDPDRILRAVSFQRTLWTDGMSKNLFFQTMIAIVSSIVSSVNYLNDQLN